MNPNLRHCDIYLNEKWNEDELGLTQMLKGKNNNKIRFLKRIILYLKPTHWVHFSIVCLSLLHYPTNTWHFY